MFRRIVVAAAVIAAMVAPAHALTTNELFWEFNVAGDDGGGNLSDTQVSSLITTNESLLGLNIDLVGTVNILQDGSAVFSPASGTSFTSSMLTGFTCDPGSSNDDCKTGFTVTFDFSGLEQEWQIVKLAVKADGPTHPNGIFFVCEGACEGTELQTPPLDPFQGAHVSLPEWNEYCGDATNCTFNPGVSHFLVFATSSTTTSVPEPATLLLLGAGLLGVTLVAPRRTR